MVRMAWTSGVEKVCSLIKDKGSALYNLHDISDVMPNLQEIERAAKLLFNSGFPNVIALAYSRSYSYQCHQ